MRIHTHSKWKSQSSAYRLRESAYRLRESAYRLREKVLKGRYRRWHGNDYKASVTGLTLYHYGSPVISSSGTSQYESHSFVEPVKRSREISLQNAAFRQSVRHRVSFRRLPSYTPAPLRGPLPLKGAQDVTGYAFCRINHPEHSAKLATGVATPLSGCAGLPPIQGENRASLYLPIESCGTLLSVHSPPASAGGRWWRSHQRGCLFSIARQGGCMVLLTH